MAGGIVPSAGFTVDSGSAGGTALWGRVGAVVKTGAAVKAGPTVAIGAAVKAGPTVAIGVAVKAGPTVSTGRIGGLIKFGPAVATGSVGGLVDGIGPTVLTVVTGTAVAVESKAFNSADVLSQKA